MAPNPKSPKQASLRHILGSSGENKPVVVDGEKTPLFGPPLNKPTCQPCSPPARYVLAFWSFWGFFNLFSLRMDINVAILAMVKHNTSTPVSHQTIVNASLDCGEELKLINRTCNEPPTFDWSSSQQNIVLSAFYYGYFSTQIAGGLLARKYGGKLVLGLGLLVNSILSLLTPWAAVTSYYVLIATRLIQGFTQGLAQPCMHTMWTQWAPEHEKSKLMTITYAGCQAGTVVATWLTAYVCDWEEIGGWPWVFYIFGALGLLWSVNWLLLIHNTPQEHPRITDKELRYLEEHIIVPIEGAPIKPPWSKVMRSPALWAIIAAHTANDWGFFALTVVIPSYLNHILKYELKENGFMSSLPFIVMTIVNPLSGVIADKLRANDIMSTKNTRKLMNSVGLLIPSVLLFCVCFTENRAATVTLLTFAVGITGFTMAGFSVNHLDIAPEFAGVLFGLTNTIGTTTGFIGPAVLAYLVSGEQQSDIHQWRIFFYLSSAIFMVGGLVFLFFAQGEPQDWGIEGDQEKGPLWEEEGGAGGPLKCPAGEHYIQPESHSVQGMGAGEVYGTPEDAEPGSTGEPGGRNYRSRTGSRIVRSSFSHYGQSF